MAKKQTTVERTIAANKRKAASIEKATRKKCDRVSAQLIQGLVIIETGGGQKLILSEATGRKLLVALKSLLSGKSCET